MSARTLIIVLFLSGQVAGQDRYETPFGGQSATGSPAAVNEDHPSATGSDARRGPPPPREDQAGPYAVPGSSAPGSGRQAPLTDDSRRDANPSSSTPPGSASATDEDGGTSFTTRQDDVGMKPSVMMRAMLSVPDGARLSGSPLSLDEVVVGATTRLDQSQRVNAYWDLCSSVADYYLGLREQEELRRLKTLVTNVGPMWLQAEAELGLRVGTSQRAAVASQYRLANLIGRGEDAFLPLPGDLPHCGDYYTRFDQVFAGRQSSEAEQLSELLPLRYEELKDAAAAVTRAEQFVDSVATRPSGAADQAEMLRALKLLALRRRAFVQIARDYNHGIARYAELAAPGPIDSDRLIGMLIKRDDATSTATRSSTAAPPSNRQSQIPPMTPPATFTEGWSPVDERRRSAATRDGAVEPASAEMEQTLRREHSLLVPSK